MAPRTRIPRRIPSVVVRVASLGLVVVALFLLYSSISAFLQGRYLPSRSSSGRSVRAAWQQYGPGAFAADSAVYLLFAGVMVAVVVFAVVLFVAKDLAAHLRLVARVAGVSITVTALGSLGLLVGYWVSGVPYRNFQPMNADALLYSTTMLIPLVSLVGVALVFFRCRVAPNVRRVAGPSDED